jgi:hypothetical protein
VVNSSPETRSELRHAPPPSHNDSLRLVRAEVAVLMQALPDVAENIALIAAWRDARDGFLRDAVSRGVIPKALAHSKRLGGPGSWYAQGGREGLFTPEVGSNALANSEMEARLASLGGRGSRQATRAFLDGSRARAAGALPNELLNTGMEDRSAAASALALVDTVLQQYRPPPLKAESPFKEKPLRRARTRPANAASRPARRGSGDELRSGCAERRGTGVGGSLSGVAPDSATLTWRLATSRSAAARLASTRDALASPSQTTPPLARREGGGAEAVHARSAGSSARGKRQSTGAGGSAPRSEPHAEGARLQAPSPHGPGPAAGAAPEAAAVRRKASCASGRSTVGRRALRDDGELLYEASQVRCLLP